MFSVERHISPVSTRFCDQSLAWHRIMPRIVLVYLAKGNTGSVKFTFTHAHTRDNLFE
jgi:hypothetical protein